MLIRSGVLAHMMHMKLRGNGVQLYRYSSCHSSLQVDDNMGSLSLNVPFDAIETYTHCECYCNLTVRLSYALAKYASCMRTSAHRFFSGSLLQASLLHVHSTMPNGASISTI
jgi:hypothetical protein